MRHASIIAFVVLAGALSGCASTLRSKPAPVTKPDVPHPARAKTQDVELFPYQVEAPGIPAPLPPRAVPTPTWTNTNAPGTVLNEPGIAPTAPTPLLPNPPSNAPPNVPTPQRPRIPKPPVPSAPSASSAAPAATVGQPVQALLKQADALHAGGDLLAAAATLERGLRIEPRNPYLWNRLARVRLAQGQAAQASSLAEKSKTLAAHAPGLLEDNERIITQARQGGGH